MFDVGLLVTSGDMAAEASARVNIGKALAAKREYGKYMILDCSDGTRVAKAELADMNTDPRGKMFAERIACVNDGAFVLYGAALSADGIEKDVEVRIPGGFEKKSGVPLSVSVIVNIECENDFAVLTGGDNPLVRWLLTGGELAASSALFGSCREPLGVAPPAPDGITEGVPAAVELSENGVAFSAVGPLTCEALVAVNGKVAIRALPLASNSKTLTAAARADINGLVYTNTEISEVLSLTAAGAPVTDFRVHRGRSAVRGTFKLPFKVGKDCVLIGDGENKLAAAVSDGEATILCIEDASVNVLAQHGITCAKENVRLTSDGCLFCLCGNVLTRIAVDGERTDLAVPVAETFEVVCPSPGSYTAALRSGGMVRMYRLSAQTATLVETLDAGTPCAVGKVNGKRIAVCGPNMGGCIFDGCYGSADAEYALALVFEDHDPIEIALDGHLVAYTDGDGVTGVTDYFAFDGRRVNAAVKSLGGEVCIVGNTAYYTALAGGVASVPAPEADICAAARLDSLLLFADKDGTLTVMSLGGSGTLIESDSITPRANVTYAYRAPALKGANLKAVVSVSFKAAEEENI